MGLYVQEFGSNYVYDKNRRYFPRNIEHKIHNFDIKPIIIGFFSQTDHTLNHQFKLIICLVFVENNLLYGFSEEISAFLKEILRLWVAWVRVFSCLITYGHNIISHEIHYLH